MNRRISVIACSILIGTLASRATATTVYDDLSEWQTAVGDHELTVFGGIRVIPVGGGSFRFADGWRYTAEDNIWIDEEQGEAYQCPGVVLGELCGPEEHIHGPIASWIEFDEPVLAFGFNTDWVEDVLHGLWVDGQRYEFGLHAFFGLVLDAPISLIEFDPDGYELSDFRFSQYIVPEPTTGLLISLGLFLMSSRMRMTRRLPAR